MELSMRGKELLVTFGSERMYTKTGYRNYESEYPGEFIKKIVDFADNECMTFYDIVQMLNLQHNNADDKISKFAA